MQSKTKSDKAFIGKQSALTYIIKKFIKKYLKMSYITPYDKKNIEIMNSIENQDIKEMFFNYLLVSNMFSDDIKDYDNMHFFNIDRKERSLNKKDFKELKLIRNKLANAIFFTSKDAFNILLDNPILDKKDKMYSYYRELIVLYGSLYILYNYKKHDLEQDVSLKNMYKAYDVLIKRNNNEKYKSNYKLLIYNLISEYFPEKEKYNSDLYYDITTSVLDIDLVFTPSDTGCNFINFDEDNSILLNILGVNDNLDINIDLLNEEHLNILEEIRENKDFVVTLHKYNLIGNENDYSYGK